MKIFFTGVYNIIPLPEPMIPARPVIDTSTKNKNRQFGHLCELKEKDIIYFNNLPKESHCKDPMPSEFLNYINILMTGAAVEEYKIEIAENVCRNNCLNVEQLNQLLKYIDYEIEKLKLVRLAYFNLTDQANQKNLAGSFRFESSLNELNQFLKNADQYKPANDAGCKTKADQKLVDHYVQNLSAPSNDSERFDVFKKSYNDLCYSVQQVVLILNTFIHDREKLEAAKLLYFNCTEKEKYQDISQVFSYNQTISELKEFIDKQNH
jgi:hypothetical protein